MRERERAIMMTQQYTIIGDFQHSVSPNKQTNAKRTPKTGAVSPTCNPTTLFELEVSSLTIKPLAREAKI
jgi:hypothetical protein